MRTSVLTLFLTMLAASGCNSTSTIAENRENCDLSPHWHQRDVEPPILVKVWKVGVQRDNVDPDGKPTKDEIALKAIGSTRDYDPGAYVLLNRGTAPCGRVKAFAQQVGERFKCAENYCYYYAPASD